MAPGFGDEFAGTPEGGSVMDAVVRWFRGGNRRSAVAKVLVLAVAVAANLVLIRASWADDAAGQRLSSIRLPQSSQGMTLLDQVQAVGIVHASQSAGPVTALGPDAVAAQQDPVNGPSGLLAVTSVAGSSVPAPADAAVPAAAGGTVPNTGTPAPVASSTPAPVSTPAPSPTPAATPTASTPVVVAAHPSTPGQTPKPATVITGVALTCWSSIGAGRAQVTAELSFSTTGAVNAAVTVGSKTTTRSVTQPGPITMRATLQVTLEELKTVQCSAVVGGANYGPMSPTA